MTASGWRANNQVWEDEKENRDMVTPEGGKRRANREMKGKQCGLGLLIVTMNGLVAKTLSDSLLSKHVYCRATWDYSFKERRQYPLE